MSSLVCDCPFCPLAEIKLNICDVRVDLSNKEILPEDVTLPDDLLNEIKDDTDYLKKRHFFRQLFLIITLWFRNNKNLKKKNQCLTIERDDFTCSCKVIQKNVFKLCFHTEKNLCKE